MDLLALLQIRFESNKARHANVSWEDVQKRIEGSPAALASLSYMEESGGEPDVIGFAEDGHRLIICDCSKESPIQRRSCCYDETARLARKKNPPSTSALEEATKHGLSLLDYDLYQRLQQTGEYDLSTSSWIAAPSDIRCKGGALFCERRYGHVFVFHNGADSYYSSRGWRGFFLL